MTKQKVTAQDITEITSVAAPVFHPTEDKVAYVATAINAEKNTYESSIYVTTVTGEPVQWTHQKDRISSVKWSPNGSYLSFLSNRNEKNQLYILPVTGGESRQLTTLPYGVSSYEWDPSEQTLWITARYDAETGWEEPEEKKDEFPKTYTAKKMKYIQDGGGLVDHSKYSQIGRISLDGNLELWSNEHKNESVQAVSPDGKQLVISSTTLEDDQVFESAVYLADVETKTKTAVTNEPGYYGGAAYSKDGRYLAFVGSNRTFENATHSNIYVYDLQAKTVESLTEGLDAPVGDYVVADVQQGASAPSVVWTKDKHLYFQLSTQGDVRIYAAALDGQIYPVTGENEHVYGYSVNADATTLAVTVSNPVFPGELIFHEIQSGERKQKTNHNKDYMETKQLIEPEAIVFEGPLGWQVHGWLIKPPEAQEGKVPLVTNIHGGPHAFYANTFFHEMQLLASQGFGVLYINPRGSHSYSQEFVDAVRGDYGGNDYQDILAAVDYVVEQYEWVDSNRLGVTGGSYGGFMTNWIVGHTDRFKAAVTQRSISNWISFYGVSDIGYYFTEWQIQSDMTDIDKLWDHSPLKYAANVTTPLLILHGEDDLRCPIEQAQQLYITLKRMGKETEFVRFPNADHNLSRTGLPNLRIARLEEITGWFVNRL